MSKEQALKSKSFCSAPWTAVYQAPNGDISPCCIWKGSLGNANNENLDDIFSSDKVKKIKKNMLTGKTIPECEYCTSLEKKSGSDSNRLFFNNHFIDKIDWETSRTKFLYWDLRISNLCNFKCRMCSHECSSEWYDDLKVLGKEPISKIIKIDDKSNFWKQIQLHYEYVESVYFAGAEPFMNEHHYTILEDLASKKLFNTKIIVNTNASINYWKKKKILDYYRPFNKVVFGFSIDGSYELGEYIRKGLDYKKWKENIKEYVDYISERDSWDIGYVFQFTFGVANVHNIIPFITDLLNDKLITKFCQFKFQPIVEPIEQSVKSLPPIIFKNFKNDAENLKSLLQIHGLDERTIEPIQHEIDKVIRYIENTPFEKKYLKDFYKNQEILDKVRGERIYDIIPDYKKLLENNKSII